MLVIGPDYHRGPKRCIINIEAKISSIYTSHLVPSMGSNVSVMTSHGSAKPALEKLTSQLSLVIQQCTGRAVKWIRPSLIIFLVGFPKSIHTCILLYMNVMILSCNKYLHN